MVGRRYRGTQRKPAISAELSSTSWIDLEDIAANFPADFILQIWPWFIRLCEQGDHIPQSRLNVYWCEYDLCRQFGPEDESHGSLACAINTAVSKLAQTDSESFARFLSNNQSRDSLAIQLVLSQSIIDSAAINGELGFMYLTSDSRRLFLGTSANGMHNTQRLISAVVPYWTDQQLTDFQRYVLHWSPYRDEEADVDDIRYTMNYRARLLACLPSTSLLPESQSALATYEETHPDPESDPYLDGGMREVRSPITATEMSHLQDSDILKLFDELADSTGWHHPSDRMKGGSIQASREFCEFAEGHAERAESIILQFSPGRHERPAGEAIVALVKTKIQPEILFQLVRELNQKGFATQEFRDDVSVALHEVAVTNKGLPNDLCSLLRTWLLDDPIPITSETESQEDVQEEEHIRSLLWDGNRLITVPRQWYYRGLALKLGLCLRPSPQTTEWLEILDLCIARTFPVKVWQQWLWDLTNHYVPDRAATAIVIGKLLLARTDVLTSVEGILWLANEGMLLNENQRSILIRTLSDSPWSRARQAIGEVSTVWALRDEDQLSLNLVESILSNDSSVGDFESMKVGVAFAAANLWTEPSWRNEAASYLCRLTTAHSTSVGRALMNAFLRSNCLQVDFPTHSFLSALARNFDFASVQRSYWFTRHLLGLLPHEAETVLRVCERIVLSAKSAGSSSQTHLGSSMPHLVAISLTLHRNPKHRQGALNLFEDLLELGAEGASDALTELDQRPIESRALVID